MEPGYLDPPLDKVVTDEHFAAHERIHKSDLLDNPISLADWFPAMPYFNGPSFGHALEAYYNRRDECWKDLEKYDTLLLPGGSGPMVDMVNNERLHDVILGFLAQDKLIAAECYCVTCLAFARDWTERKSIIWGKHVTGTPASTTTRTGPDSPAKRSPAQTSGRLSTRSSTSCATPLALKGNITAALGARSRPSSTIRS